MKPYFFKICNLINVALIPALLIISGCRPGMVVPSRVDVYTKKSMGPFLAAGHLAVLPFESPGFSPDPGITAARLFGHELIRKEFFRKVTFVEHSPWMQKIDGRNDRIRKALTVAKQTGADLALIGSVDNIYQGQTTETRLSVTARIISTATGKTYWWGRHTVVGIPGNTYFPVDFLLPPEPPSASRLLSYSVAKMTSDMVPRADLILRHVVNRSDVNKAELEKPYRALETLEPAVSASVDDISDAEVVELPEPELEFESESTEPVSREDETPSARSSGLAPWPQDPIDALPTAYILKNALDDL